MLKQFPGNRPLGIALISVLLISLVVSMLAVSMLSITRSSKFAHLQQENWSRSMDACYSGLDFAKSRLKQDKGWGTTAFTGVGNLNNPDLVVSESGSLVSGKQPPLNQAFQLEVANNLSGFASSPSPAWSRSKIDLPPHTALVRVTGTSGGAKKSIEVLLSKAQFSQNSIFAGKDVYFNTDKTILRSTLPKGNRARATRNIFMNNPDFFDFAPGNPGKLQAGVDTIIRNRGATIDPTNSDVTAAGPLSKSLTATPGLAANVSTNIHGMVELNTPPVPPVFNKDKLTSPSTSALTLKPGNYKFISHNQVQLPNGSVALDSIPSQEGSSAVLIRDYQFKPQGYIKVDGNINISAEIQKSEYDSDTGVTRNFTESVPATLALGYDDAGFPVTKDPSAPTPTSPSDHRLEVTGDLTVSGDLAGSGQIVVNKIDSVNGGTLAVQGNSYMSAARTNQMAVTAQRRVDISVVSADAAEQPFAMHQADILAFSLVGSSISSGSPNGVTMDNLTAANQTSLRDLAGASDNPGASSIRQTIVPSYSTTMLSKLITSSTPPRTFPNGAVNITAEDATLINNFVRDAENSGGMTIGKHLRLREFLKSIERKSPERNFIDPTMTASDPANGVFSYSDVDGRIQAAAVNQIFTLNQDARAKGIDLRTHLTAAQLTEYAEELRTMTVFGGLLHSEGSIQLQSAGGLNLLGIVLTSLGSIHIKSRMTAETRITYDPSAFEDHLDQSAGFTTLFFWSND
jgi:Tfp pilus assembly protein PilX